jgi:hypothetical protein
VSEDLSGNFVTSVESYCIAVCMMNRDIQPSGDTIKEKLKKDMLLITALATASPKFSINVEHNH